jgi:hypothetical protein
MTNYRRFKTEPQLDFAPRTLNVSLVVSPSEFFSVRHEIDNEKIKRSINSKSLNLKLPKIRGAANLSDVEKDLVNDRILNIKKLNYDPIGCSKSSKL